MWALVEIIAPIMLAVAQQHAKARARSPIRMQNQRIVTTAAYTVHTHEPSPYIVCNTAPYKAPAEGGQAEADFQGRIYMECCRASRISMPM